MAFEETVTVIGKIGRQLYNKELEIYEHLSSFNKSNQEYTDKIKELKGKINNKEIENA